MWYFPLLSMGLFGIVFGVGLAYASKKFAVETDPRVDNVINALPGANCGACGFPGCAGFAAAVVAGTAAPNLCSPGGAETVQSIASILGLEAETTEPKVVFIGCKGAKEAKKDSIYTGVKSCALAALVARGPIACKNACLMMGDCFNVCPFDAIKWEDGNIPVILEDKCTGCGKCIKACPKEIINFRPLKKRVLVLCQSEDKGAVARKKCDVACIGCTKCVKACPVDAITMERNHAIIDTEKCVLCGKCISECPTNAIWDGRVSRASQREQSGENQ